MGKEKGRDNKTRKSLRVKGQGFVIFVIFSLLGAQVGKEKGTDNKKGFAIFVVFSLLGAQVGKEKGTDNKNSKSLRVKDLLFLLSLAF